MAGPTINSPDKLKAIYKQEETLEFDKIFEKGVRNDRINTDQYTVGICFIDDGSKDKSYEIIRELCEKDSFVSLIRLERNFGKEAALCAGLENALGDALIPIDVDLQDPPELIELMVKEFLKGEEVVLAKRKDRRSDSFLKRKTASWFYYINNLLCKPKIESNVGDFRLLSRRVVDEIGLLQEKNIFMKGLLSWPVGKFKIIEFVRNPRIAGKSKFNAWKLLNFAIEGITSFSTVPLRLAGYLGLIISIFSFFLSCYYIFEKIYFGNEVRGFPSLIISILFLGGIQLFFIGLLGEYIGKIYIEVKNRPRYLIRETIN